MNFCICLAQCHELTLHRCHELSLTLIEFGIQLSQVKLNVLHVDYPSTLAHCRSAAKSSVLQKNVSASVLPLHEDKRLRIQDANGTIKYVNRVAQN